MITTDSQNNIKVTKNAEISEKKTYTYRKYFLRRIVRKIRQSTFHRQVQKGIKIKSQSINNFGEPVKIIFDYFDFTGF